MTTSNQIVTINIDDTSMNGEIIKTVTATNIYEELGVQKDFTNWVKAQIKRAGLEENTDFVTSKLDSPKKADQVHGGDRKSVEYHFTVNAAKHIAMISNTAAGKLVRNYFIQVEKDHQKLLNSKLQTLSDNKYTEIGEALVRAVRYQEYDSAKELDAMLDKLDFEPAARTEGVPVSVIRNRIALHTAATVRLDHIARGENGHGDSVRDVVSLAQAKAQTEDMELKIENRRLLEIARAKKPPTLDEIVAYDMAHKHDNTVRKLRAVKK